MHYPLESQKFIESHQFIVIKLVKKFSPTRTAALFGMPEIALTGGYYMSELAPANPAFYAAILIPAATVSHLASTKTPEKYHFLEKA